jgi:hypothetical protein
VKIQIIVEMDSDTGVVDIKGSEVPLPVGQMILGEAQRMLADKRLGIVLQSEKASISLANLTKIPGLRA